MVNTLMQGVVGIVAGWDWARTEAQIIGSSDPEVTLSRLQSMVNHNSGFASVIVRDAEGIKGGRKQLFAWFTDLAKRYRIETDSDLCQFALEFASRPYALPRLYLEGLENNIRRAQANKTLVRAARLVVLCKSGADGKAPRLLPETDS